MDILIKIGHFLQALSQKQFKQYFMIFLVITGVSIGATLFFIYQNSTDLLAQIKKVEDLSQKSNKILLEHAQVQQDVRQIQELIEKNQNFNLKSYFETFCKEQSITAEPGWDTRTDEINDRISEIRLPALFKGQTTEKLVKILDILDKQPILYVKDLTIKNDANKKINFEITIATRVMKKGLDVKGF